MRFSDYISKKISFWNRTRKWKYFCGLFNAEEHPKVLDVGYTNFNMGGVIRSNWLENNYPYLSDVTALGIENSDNFQKEFPSVKVIQYDGWTFPFEDNEFDVVFSNAVLEHVGYYEEQVQFIKELVRVGTDVIYFTTPNRFFPIEIHSRYPFVHWLPKNIFDKILVLTGKHRIAGNNMNLLGLKNIKNLLMAAGVDKYEIKRNKVLCFTMDFSIVVKKYT